MAWDPEQYLKFQSSRFAPFNDLVQLIRVRSGLRVLDLGCGTGELTLKLQELLPDSRVTGLDASAEMLERAAQLTRPGLQFRQGTVEAVAGTWDLVFSHAVLHWVDDHVRLFPQLLRLLAPGGQLAVQMPANHRHPAHLAIVEIAREEPFAAALNNWVRQSPMLEIDSYAELLFRHGAEEITALEKVYPTVMADGPAIAEWTRGSTLVPYLERLPAHLHELFLARYRQRLAELYPHSPVYYTFRRILLSAIRPH
jgi:trans-aconitate 2-methyltransferase